MGRKKSIISFEDFYEDMYESRWPQLKHALLGDSAYYELKTAGDAYFLDEASYYTALQLAPQPGERVLDMCAAPGGKTLVLLHRFPDIELIANERSSTRRDRLHRVLRQHLTAGQLQRVSVTGFDARVWFQHEQAAYERILLDVPCSSERHILHSDSHLKKWSPARSKHLAIQAFAMLASALEVVKPGGLIVYSTCALSALENDGVIQKMYKKRAGRFELQSLHLPFGEQTRYGWQVLPDTAEGRGPMYAAGIRKIDIGQVSEQV